MDKKSILPEELVLKLNGDANNLDLSKYEDFLYELCGEWDFQKEAIRNSLRFFISEKYDNTEELFNENYDKNIEMQNFQDKISMSKNLPFPHKKSCTIDLATGTGKSWVMYGVARILLAEGLVDQVLILCPSLTIKQGLTEKFKSFARNSILTDSLPKNSIIKVPRIKHSDSTIEKGDICVDNVHKTYDHVSSSINDSLIGKGSRTLVINDEAHHILNPKGAGESSKMLEWKKFLDDERFNFKNILNLTGTPYKGDLYFNDVIYRFSIRNAIGQKFIKEINYLEKDESRNEEEKWKAIIDRHESIKKEYSKAKKHITIIVTNSIAKTDQIVDKVKRYFKKFTKISPEDIEKKIIPVTSSKNHSEFREILKNVDDPINPVEWIVSVSMLTEGWDVKNIFQIVPDDERAFNSKLLISQVLGRGLRIPNEYRKETIIPEVKIFNHVSWSSKISNLVMEVAEISNIIKNDILKDSKYNFNLHLIKTDKRVKTGKIIPQKTEISLPNTLGFKSTDLARSQIEVNVRTQRKKLRRTDVSSIIKKYTPEQAINSIWSELYLFDASVGTKFSERANKEYIRKLVTKELQKIGESFVSEENLQNGKKSFNVLKRPYVGFSKIEEIYGDIKNLNTSKMESSTISEANLKHYGGLATSKKNIKNLDKNILELINKIKKELNVSGQTTFDGQEYIQPRIFDRLEDNEYKSPLNITLVSYKPERDFVEKLVMYYSNYIDAWIKSRDQGFYEIPYIHRPGTHSLEKPFNPDFFIKKGKKIVVVETKADDDLDVKNKDKLTGTLIYFQKLNEKLDGEFIYEFHFLTPKDYDLFFEKVIKKGEKFVGQLHSELEQKSREELKEEKDFVDHYELS